jgi:hypothetical protein
VAKQKWEGPLGVEGQYTGDRRIIQPGVLEWTTSFPKPIRWASADEGKHTGAEVVGHIDWLSRRENGELWGFGTFDTDSAKGKEAARQVGEKLTNGVSLDLDNIAFDVVESEEFAGPNVAPEDSEVMSITGARVRAVTLVALPAFEQAHIKLVDEWSMTPEEQAAFTSTVSTTPDDESTSDSIDEEVDPENDDEITGALAVFIEEAITELGLQNTDSAAASTQDSYKVPESLAHCISNFCSNTPTTAVVLDSSDQNDGPDLYCQDHFDATFPNGVGDNGGPGTTLPVEIVPDGEGMAVETPPVIETRILESGALRIEIPSTFVTSRTGSTFAGVVDANDNWHDPLNGKYVDKPSKILKEFEGVLGSLSPQDQEKVKGAVDNATRVDMEGDLGQISQAGVALQQTSGDLKESYHDPKVDDLADSLHDSGSFMQRNPQVVAAQPVRKSDMPSDGPPSSAEAGPEHTGDNPPAPGIDSSILDPERASRNADQNEIAGRGLDPQLSYKSTSGKIVEIPRSEHREARQDLMSKTKADNLRAIADQVYIDSRADGKSHDEALQAMNDTIDLTKLSPKELGRLVSAGGPQAAAARAILAEKVSRNLVEGEQLKGAPAPAFDPNDLDEKAKESARKIKEQIEGIDKEEAEQFNWVDDAGGLPDYIKRIKKHLEEKGMTESHAIAVAVNVVKKMCATGDINFPGKQNVNAGSRAEACAAVAHWEEMKARAHANAVDDVEFVTLLSGMSEEEFHNTFDSEIETDFDLYVSFADDGTVEFRQYTQSTLDAYVKKGYAMKGGSYPIATVEDLRNAIQAYGRAGDNKDDVKAHIKKRAHELKQDDLIPENWAVEVLDRAALVASGVKLAAPIKPPKAWFDDPQFKMPTPLTVTKEGRVFGHLATKGTCHTAMPNGAGECVTVPLSGNGYSWFHTGVVETAEGTEALVGRITMKTGHANDTFSSRKAIEHYENTGLAIADVHAGEDQFGVWISGALRPDASEMDIRALKASPLSGDWRWSDQTHNLELVMALAVNMPGFPVPRPHGLVASGSLRSLVAAGMLPPATVPRELVESAKDDPTGLDAGTLRYLKQLAQKSRNEEAENLRRRALVASGAEKRVRKMAAQLKKEN